MSIKTKERCIVVADAIRPFCWRNYVFTYLKYSLYFIPGEPF